MRTLINDGLTRFERYALRHPERRRATYARYHAANRERRNAEERKRYSANRDQRLAWAAEYRRLNREKVYAATRTWAKANPDRRAALQNKRRVMQQNAPGSHTFTEWTEKLELLGGCCIYCGRSDLVLTRDHKIPLSRGGGDNIENIVPACKPCNSRKHSMTAAEFFAAGCRRVAA